MVKYIELTKKASEMNVAGSYGTYRAFIVWAADTFTTKTGLVSSNNKKLSPYASSSPYEIGLVPACEAMGMILLMEFKKKLFAGASLYFTSNEIMGVKFEGEITAVMDIK